MRAPFSRTFISHKVAAGISRSLCTDTAVHRDKADIDFADVVVGCLHLWHTHNPVNAVTVFTSIQHNKQPSGQAGVEDGTEQETIRRLACPDALYKKSCILSHSIVPWSIRVSECATVILRPLTSHG